MAFNLFNTLFGKKDEKDTSGSKSPAVSSSWLEAQQNNKKRRTQETSAQSAPYVQGQMQYNNALEATLASRMQGNAGSYVNALGSIVDVFDGKQEETGNAWVDAIQRGKTASGRLYREADYLSDKSRDLDEWARSGKNAVENFGLDLLGGAVDLAGDQLLNLAVPGAGMAAMATRSYGAGAQEARYEGKDLSHQILAGAKSAAIEWATEKVAGVGGRKGVKPGWIDGALDKAVDRFVEKGGNALLGKMAVAFGSEAAEEILSGILNPLADRMLKLDDGTGSAWDNINWGETLYEGLIGGVLGLGGGAVEGIKYNRAQAQQVIQQSVEQAVDKAVATSQTPEATRTAPDATQASGDIPALPSTQNASAGQSGALNSGSSEGATLTPIQQVQEMLMKPVSNKAAERMLADQRITETLRSLGIDLSGTKSQQRAAVKDAAQQVQNKSGSFYERLAQLAPGLRNTQASELNSKADEIAPVVEQQTPPVEQQSEQPLPQSQGSGIIEAEGQNDGDLPFTFGEEANNAGQREIENVDQRPPWEEGGASKNSGEGQQIQPGGIENAGSGNEARDSDVGGAQQGSGAPGANAGVSADAFNRWNVADDDPGLATLVDMGFLTKQEAKNIIYQQAESDVSTATGGTGKVLLSSELNSDQRATSDAVKKLTGKRVYFFSAPLDVKKAGFFSYANGNIYVSATMRVSKTSMLATALHESVHSAAFEFFKKDVAAYYSRMAELSDIGFDSLRLPEGTVDRIYELYSEAYYRNYFGKQAATKNEAHVAFLSDSQFQDYVKNEVITAFASGSTIRLDPAFPVDVDIVQNAMREALDKEGVVKKESLKDFPLASEVEALHNTAKDTQASVASTQAPPNTDTDMAMAPTSYADSFEQNAPAEEPSPDADSIQDLEKAEEHRETLGAEREQEPVSNSELSPPKVISMLDSGLHRYLGAMRIYRDGENVILSRISPDTKMRSDGAADNISTALNYSGILTPEIMAGDRAKINAAIQKLVDRANRAWRSPDRHSYGRMTLENAREAEDAIGGALYLELVRDDEAARAALAKAVGYEQNDPVAKEAPSQREPGEDAFSEQSVDEREDRVNSNEEERFQETRYNDKHGFDSAKGWQEQQKADAEAEARAKAPIDRRKTYGNRLENIDAATERIRKASGQEAKTAIPDSAEEFLGKSFDGAKKSVGKLAEDFAAAFSAEDDGKSLKELAEGLPKRIKKDKALQTLLGDHEDGNVSKAAAAMLDAENETDFQNAASDLAEMLAKEIEELPKTLAALDAWQKNTAKKSKFSGFLASDKPLGKLASVFFGYQRDTVNILQGLDGFDKYGGGPGYTLAKAIIDGNHKAMMCLGNALDTVLTAQDAFEKAGGAEKTVELSFIKNKQRETHTITLAEAIDMLKNIRTMQRSKLSPYRDVYYNFENARIRLTSREQFDAVMEALDKAVLQDKTAKAYYDALTEGYNIFKDPAKAAVKNASGRTVDMYSKDYYPLLYGEEHKGSGEHGFDFGLDETAFTQRRTQIEGGSVTITDPAVRFRSYSQQASKLIGRAEVGAQMERLNRGGVAPSITDIVAERYGEGHTDVIEQFIKDTSNFREEGEAASSILRQLRLNIQGGALFGNFGSMLKQFPSVFNAAGILDFDSIVHGVTAQFTNKEARERAGSLGSIKTRHQGNLDPSVSETLSENSGFKKAMEKLKILKFVKEGFEITDSAVIRSIFLASEYQVEVKDNISRDSPEFEKAVMDYFVPAFMQTQPQFDKTLRPYVQTSENELIRMFGMFKTQPLRNLNTMIRTVSELEAVKGKYGKNSKEYKATEKQLRTTVAGQASASLMFGALGALAKLLYHRNKDLEDEDGKLDGGKLMARILMNAAEAAGGSMIFGDAAVQLAIDMASGGTTKEFYGLSAGAVSSVADALDAINTFSSKPTLNNAKKAAGYIATLFGIPLNNAYAVLNSAIMYTKDIAGDNEGNYDDILKAIDAEIKAEKKAEEKAAKEAEKAAEEEVKKAETVSGYLKKPFEALTGSGMEAKESKALLEEIDTDGNDSIKQAELWAWYEAHPDQESIAILMWNAYGWKTSWDSYKTKHSKKK